MAVLGIIDVGVDTTLWATNGIYESVVGAFPRSRKTYLEDSGEVLGFGVRLLE